MNRRAVISILAAAPPCRWRCSSGLVLADGSSASAASIPPPITLSGLPAPTARISYDAGRHHGTAHHHDAPPTTTEAPTTTTSPPTTTEAPTTTTAAAVQRRDRRCCRAADRRRSAATVVTATAVVQARLLQLGFWNGGADGKYGFTTKQAVMAFQKYIGLPADRSRRPGHRRLPRPTSARRRMRRRHRHPRRGRQGQAVAVHRRQDGKTLGRSTRRPAVASPTRRRTRTTRPRSRRATR